MMDNPCGYPWNACNEKKLKPHQPHGFRDTDVESHQKRSGMRCDRQSSASTWLWCRNVLHILVADLQP
jgi:hypothetical protein